MRFQPLAKITPTNNDMTKINLWSRKNRIQTIYEKKYFTLKVFNFHSVLQQIHQQQFAHTNIRHLDSRACFIYFSAHFEWH